MKRKSPRKTMTAYACVGNHGWPFAVLDAHKGQEHRIGQMEIFTTYQDAARHALGPGYVRKVRLYIDREPA